jgi:hypothetical protein
MINKLYLGNLALLLIALGTGYLVCLKANKEDKNLKVLGYIIGIFIIVTSILLTINSFAGIRREAKFKKMPTATKSTR